MREGGLRFLSSYSRTTTNLDAQHFSSIANVDVAQYAV